MVAPNLRVCVIRCISVDLSHDPGDHPGAKDGLPWSSQSSSCPSVHACMLLHCDQFSRSTDLTLPCCPCCRPEWHLREINFDGDMHLLDVGTSLLYTQVASDKWPEPMGKMVQSKLEPFLKSYAGALHGCVILRGQVCMQSCCDIGVSTSEPSSCAASACRHTLCRDQPCHPEHSRLLC